MKHLMILSLLVFLSQPLWAADKKRIYITDLPFETIESTTSVSEVEIGWLERGVNWGLIGPGRAHARCRSRLGKLLNGNGAR